MKSPKMVPVSGDFKKARFAEWLYSRQRGAYLLMRECAELIGGRWEPFLSIEAIQKVNG